MKDVSYDEFADEHLTRIVPAYFFITTRERNAWHGTLSRRYRGPASLTCTLAEAKKVAERWRAQGSTFSIQEIPGLHIMSEWTDIGLVEFHTDDSFSSWDARGLENVRPGVSLRRALDALGVNGPWKGDPPSIHSFVAAVLEGEDVSQPLGPRAKFRAWESYSHGGGYMLGWMERAGRHRAPGVRRIARLVNSSDPVSVGNDEALARVRLEARDNPELTASDIRAAIDDDRA